MTTHIAVRLLHNFSKLKIIFVAKKVMRAIAMCDIVRSSFQLVFY